MGRTLADDLVDDVVNTFLDLEHFADTYNYTKRGGTTGSVIGNWVPDPIPDLELTRGEENCHTGKLHVAATTTLKRDDVISINSQAWTIAGVGAVNAGMQTIKLMRQDNSSRAVNGGM